MLAVLSSGLAARHYYGKAVEWREASRQSQKLARQQAATITDMNQRQQKLAELDKTHTEALSAAESENDALRRQLAAGTRRMYVSAKCPVSGTGAETGTRRMGDATAVELDNATGQNILDIRAGMIKDQAKVRYLQQFISEQCFN